MTDPDQIDMMDKEELLEELRESLATIEYVPFSFVGCVVKYARPAGLACKSKNNSPPPPKAVGRS